MRTTPTMKINTYLILAIFLLLAGLVTSQFWIEASLWKKSSQKFVEIESKIETFEQTIQQKPMIDSLAIAKLNLELMKLESKLEKSESNLRNDFYWLLRLGIPLTVVGFIGFFFGIFHTTYTLALSMAKKELAKEVMNDSKYVRTFFDVLIVHKNEGNSHKIESLLRKQGFQVKRKIFAKDFTEYDLSSYKGLVLDSTPESGDFDADEIKKILARNDFKGVIMKYGGGRVSKEVNSDRFSGATMMSQLYPNLINILIYQKYRFNSKKASELSLASSE